MSGLLATKLHLPAPPSRFVQRPHLIQRLNEGLDAGRRLTLVSAPAGFGKTTCVSAWLDRAGLGPLTWLSLDPADDDPGRFFTYLAAALGKIYPTLGDAVAAFTHPAQLPPAEVLWNTLVNALTEFPGRFLLVLDDFHLIQDAYILQVMEKLVANLPPSLHLVLLAREDPGLPLARLRAHNQLTEIRAQDLRFTTPEAGAFLNEVMGLCLSAADITVLEDRTEGWIVGLQLAGLSIRDRADPSGFIATLSGSHRYILSYLTEEVLSRQPQEIQDFLLQTSILEKLTGDLCDAVTLRADSGALLERLLAANLFLVPLDDEQRWYRYHHLFADLLAKRLKQTQAVSAIQELHSRASDWLAQNDALDEAIQHALAGKDYDRAIPWVEGVARAMMFTGRVNDLRSWLDALPQQAFEAHLHLKIYRVWLDLMQGRMDLSEPALLKMDTILRGLPPSPENDILRKEMIVILSRWVALAGNTSRAIRTSLEALDFLPEEDHASRSRIYSALCIAYGAQGDVEKADAAYRECLRLAHLSANYTLSAHTTMLRGMWQGYYGKLHEAARLYQSIIDLGAQTGQKIFYPAGQGLIGLASLYLEWCQLERAEKALQEGMALCMQAGLDGYFNGCILKSRLRQARGDLTGALDEILALEKAAPRSDTFTFAVRQIQVRLALGDVDGASRLTMPFLGALSGGPGFGEGGPPVLVIEPFQAILGRVYLAQGEFEKALQALDRLQATAEPAGRFGNLLEALLLKALVLQKQDQDGSSLQAIACLSRALILAEPEGYCLLFVEAGRPLAPLLRGVLVAPNTTARISGYAHMLLERISDEGNITPEPIASIPPPDDLIEPLTDRELDVLRLIAAGLKYEEIAAALFISLNTVRTYVKGIYAKLDVNNRSKAIAQAHLYKLI
jgi:LuxR family transcriptional regulator, maltose regulon positive regulatory protein